MADLRVHRFGHGAECGGKRVFVAHDLTKAIVAAISWGFWPRPVLVDAATATRGSLAITVEEEGKTSVIDRFVVSAPVAGFARRIELDVGDKVSQDQTLALLEQLKAEVLDPRSRAEAKARVAAARSATAAPINLPNPAFPP